MAEIYCWLAGRFPGSFTARAAAQEARDRVSRLVDAALRRLSLRQHQQGRGQHPAGGQRRQQLRLVAGSGHDQQQQQGGAEEEEGFWREGAPQQYTVDGSGGGSSKQRRQRGGSAASQRRRRPLFDILMGDDALGGAH